MKPVTIILLLIATAAFAKAASLPEGVIIEEDDDQEDQRDKRALSFLADKITSKFASKLGWVGPPGHPPPPQHDLEYGPPITYHTKNFDIWAFKKAILNALFQAVKAIKGGIIAVKGQILKAKGHLLATKGHILAAKGDAITQFGKQVAAKSLLDPSILLEGPAHSGIPISGPSGYASSSSAVKAAAPPPLPTKASIPEYKAPAEPTYGVPIPTGDSYGLFKEEPREPLKNYAQGGLPNGVHAGLLVLKPISVPATGGAGGHFAEPPGGYESPQQVVANNAPSFDYNAAGAAGSFGGYAGPLSPAAYDSFGGHPDLSGSFSQSALQSSQKKRANPLRQTAVHQQPQQLQYHQLPQQPLPHHVVQTRVVPQRTIHQRSVPHRQFYYQGPSFGQRI